MFDNMLQKDKDEFTRIANKLLNQCFLCNKNKKSKEEFVFVLKHAEIFNKYFINLGYHIEINREYEVIQLINDLKSNRYFMRLHETIILLILRILYDEKKRELSLTDSVIINIGDIQDRFLALKIRDKPIEKTYLKDTINTLKRFQIVEPLDTNITDEDARLIIYDSILMAIRVADIRKVYDNLDKYRRGANDEEDNTNEID